MFQAPPSKIIHSKRVNNLQSFRNKSYSKQLRFEKFSSQGNFFLDFVNVPRLQSENEKHKNRQKRAKCNKNMEYFSIYLSVLRKEFFFVSYFWNHPSTSFKTYQFWVCFKRANSKKNKKFREIFWKFFYSPGFFH